jgi:acetyl esterase/lipase
LTCSSPSIDENADAPILTRDDVMTFRAHYLGDADPRQPYASPLLAPDHRGLPPALVQVAEHDPIRDDGLRYATALQSAGVPVRTTTYVGMPHGYLAFPKLCRSAPQALEELCAALNTALAGDRLSRSALEPGQLSPQALNAGSTVTGAEPRSRLR